MTPLESLNLFCENQLQRLQEQLNSQPEGSSQLDLGSLEIRSELNQTWQSRHCQGPKRPNLDQQENAER